MKFREEIVVILNTFRGINANIFWLETTKPAYWDWITPRENEHRLLGPAGRIFDHDWISKEERDRRLRTIPKERSFVVGVTFPVCVEECMQDIY